MKTKYALVIIALVICTSCSKYQPYPNTPDDYFKLSVSDTSGKRNDGASLVTISLTRLASVNPGLTVTFSTQNGTILNTSADIDTNIVVNTQLQLAQDTGYYFIKALVMNGTATAAQKTLKFSLRPALADSITYDLDAYKLASGKPLTITTYLSRKFGKVSIGSTCTFRSYQIDARGDTVAVGRFTGVATNGTDSTGKLGPVLFYSDTPNIDTTRMVTIQISTRNDSRQIVKKQFSLGY